MIPITQKELKEILIVYFSTSQEVQVLEEGLQKPFWENLKIKPEKIAALKKRCSNWIVDRLADNLSHRLKRNDKIVSLFSNSDKDEFFSLVSGEIKQIVEIDEDEWKQIERFMRMVADNFLEVVQSMVSEDNAKQWWKWINTVSDIATEKGIPRKEVVLKYNDEVVRHLFSKKELISFFKKKMDKLVNVKTIEKLAQPLISMCITDDGDEEANEEANEEAKQIIKAELNKGLKKFVKKYKKFAKRILKEGVNRIYG